jgi:hypothetical protein
MAQAADIKDTYSSLGEEISLSKLWAASKVSPMLVNQLIQEFYQRVEAQGGSAHLAAVGLDFAMVAWRKATRPQ